MATIHNNTQSDFTIVSNKILRNNSLSWRAKGMLAWLLGCSEGFEVSMAGIAAMSSDGYSTVRATVSELQSAGYIIIQTKHNDGGQFDGAEWYVFSEPKLGNSTVCDLTACGKTPANNIEEINKIKCAPALPPQAIPIETIDQKAEPAVAAHMKRKLQKAKRRALTQLKSSFAPEFEALFSLWPTRPDKFEAAGAWEAAVEIGVLPSVILSAAKKQVAENGRYVGNLLNWLRNKGWDQASPQNKPQFKSNYNIAQDERRWMEQKRTEASQKPIALISDLAKQFRCS